MPKWLSLCVSIFVGMEICVQNELGQEERKAIVVDKVKSEKKMLLSGFYFFF